MKRKEIILFTLLVLTINSCAKREKLIETISSELPVSCIKISPDEKFIAIGDYTENPLGFRELNETYVIRVLHGDTYNNKYEFIGHKSWIESIDFSPDSKKLLTADRSGVIFVWDLLSGKRLCKIETDDWVHNAKFTKSGKEFIAIQGFEKQSIIYDIKGNEIARLELSKQINDFEINNKKNEIYFGCHDEIQVWSLSAREKIRSIEFSGIMCMRFDHDYSRLAIGVSNGNIIIMTNELQKLIEFEGHFKPVLALSFSFDDSKLASASSDQTARIWDLRSQDEVLQLINEHKGNVNAVEFISGKNEFITGGRNKELKIWK
jgi:WD40 repeat protein